MEETGPARKRGYTCACGAWFGWTKHWKDHQSKCSRQARPKEEISVTTAEVENHFALKERKLNARIRAVYRQLQRLTDERTALFAVRAEFRKRMGGRK